MPRKPAAAAAAATDGADAMSAEQPSDEQTTQQPTLPNTHYKIRLVISSSPPPSPHDFLTNFQLPGHSEDLTAVTFQILDEDHTLGNALRYIIMKKYFPPSPIDRWDFNFNSPGVEFCGYSIPHPSEPKMNLRIQTYGTLDVMPRWSNG